MDSDAPLIEAAHEAGLFWASYQGGAALGGAAVLGCSKLGTFAPLSSPVIVPVCIAGAAIAGGTVAFMELDLVTEGFTSYFKDKLAALTFFSNTSRLFGSWRDVGGLVKKLRTTTSSHERHARYIEALEQDRADKIRIMMDSKCPFRSHQQFGIFFQKNKDSCIGEFVQALKAEKSKLEARSAKIKVEN